MKRGVLFFWLAGIGLASSSIPALALLQCSYPTFCYHAMPLYDQTNPNFAHVTAPQSTIDKETYTDPNNSSNDLKPIPDHFGNIQNPYWNSWLPYGPIPGDPGALGIGAWYTAICGPTSQSMALRAAIAEKSSRTLIGGWTGGTFLFGTKPQDQPNDFPNPLVAGASVATAATYTGAAVTRNGLNMSKSDLQSVVDMAILQGTLPNAGGGAWAYQQTQSDFTQLAIGGVSPGGQLTFKSIPAADSKTIPAYQINNQETIDLIRQGYVIVIGQHEYTVHVNPHPLLGTEFVSFSSDGGGHVLAIDGFFLGFATTSVPITTTSGTVTQVSLGNNGLPVLIYDPVYGQREWESLDQLTAGMYNPPAGQLRMRRLLTFPGNSPAHAFRRTAYPTQPQVGSVFDFRDGDKILFVDEMYALRVQ